MKMQVFLACGHPPLAIHSDVQCAPTCPSCGETRVQSVTSRAPRFLGTCSGPYAKTEALTPGITSCAPSGALTLKAQE